LARQSGLDVFRSLFRDIRKRQSLKQIYYLYGEETFLIDMIQDEIGKLVPDDQKDFNFDLIYGRESTPEKVLGAARSYPMMAEQRVVIVRDFIKLDDSRSEGGGISEFLDYFKKPNPATILCLIDQKFPDRRRDPGKTLNELSKKNDHIGVYLFDKIQDHELPEWVIDWTSHYHKMKISPAAAQILSQLVGQNLKLLSTEIDKLCTFVDTETVIETDHVKKITESYREYNVIELKNAVLERNLDKSLFIAEQMLHKSNNSTAEIFKTVGFFYSVFSNIWQIRRLMEKGLSRQQVQEKLGLSSYIFNNQYREASKFSLADMPTIFEALLDADRSMKGFSTLDNPTIFLLLIKRIVG
jgi:DNA polymerase III subunit delta